MKKYLNNNNLLLLFFIFLNFFIIKNNAISDQEYNCLLPYTTLQWNLYPALVQFPNGTYNFCGTSSFSCDSAGNVISASIKTYSSSQPRVLEPSNFLCLPQLRELSIVSFEVTPDFMYYQFPLLTSLSFYSVKGLTGIVQKLPQLDYFHLAGSMTNTYLKLSYVSKIKTVTFNDDNVFFYLEADTPDANYRLNQLTANVKNYPDLSLYPMTTIQFVTDSTFDTKSYANFSTFKAYSFQVTNRPPPQFYFHNNFYISTIFTSSGFEKPPAYISLANNINYKSLQMSYAGEAFNINGNIPLSNVPKSTSLKISTANFPSINPGISSYGDQSTSTYFSNNKMTFSLEKFTGQGRFYDLSNNKITGTLDKSWCNTFIKISNNSMTGEIPSCFACYFNNSAVSFTDMGAVFDMFKDNQFTNLNKNYKCTTFAPVLTITSLAPLAARLSGTDIGYDFNNWKFNSVGLASTSVTTVEIGKTYDIKLTSISYRGTNYISVQFLLPNNDVITFPVIDTKPNISSVSVGPQGNSFTIGGSFFSSYAGYVQQSVSINGVQCTYPTGISTSVNFFNIQCTTSSSLNSLSGIQLLNVKTSTFSKNVYIKTTNNFLNNKQCLNCDDESLGICDLSSGTCQCNQGRTGVDCTGFTCSDPTCSSNGQCNTTKGECVCTSNFTGSDCSIPIHYITSIDASTTLGGVAKFNGWFGDVHTSLSISIGGLNCPTIQVTSAYINCTAPAGTGSKSAVVTQNGRTASFTYIYLPAKCLNDCSKQGTCNTNTGICACNSNYTSSDCSIPIHYITSIDASTTLGGVAKFNGWFGDVHTSLSISIGGLNCPTILVNSAYITCTAPAGTGSKTAVVTQNGRTASLTYQYLPAPCSNDCSNHGTCNIDTGICACSPDYTSDDCSIPIHYITSINASTTLGGVAKFNGWFGDVHTSLSISIGGSNCPIVQTNSAYINCTAPAGTGSKSAVVTQNGRTASFTYTYLPAQCLNDCSNHGTCNTDTGICACSPDYTSSDCSIPIHYITSIDASTTLGGVATFNGWFGDVHTSLSISIGGSNCPIIQTNNNYITCTAPAGTGSKTATVTQNGRTASFSYTYLPAQCLNDCSKQGTCNTNTGTCVCNSNYTSSDCSIPAHYITSIDASTTLGGNAKFNGWFGDVHTSLSISIGGLNCPIVKVNSAYITCTAPAGTGTKTSIVTQNGRTASFTYEYLPAQCLNDCSNHGICNTNTGICACNSNYTSDDCSIPAHYITSINASTTLGGNATFNGWFGNIHNDLSISIGNLDCPIIQINNESITCSAPPGTGIKTANCTQNGLSITYPYEYLPAQCLNDCSNEGTCNTNTGICACNSNYTSSDCSIPIHYISSINSSTTLGGIAFFNGWFGNIHNGLEITIGDLNCPTISNSSSMISCMAPAGSGIKKSKVTQNGQIYFYPYQYVQLIIECKNNCSGHGKCDTSNGVCDCNPDYTDYDCSIPNTDLPSTSGGGGNTKPPTNSTVDPGNGGAGMTNQEITFEIYFKTLIEVDINGDVVNSYSLQNNWKLNSTSLNDPNENVYLLTQAIQNGQCQIKSTVEEITNENGKEYTFAGTTFKLSKDSIKFSISIENYSYQSNLNTLQLVLISSVDDYSDYLSGNCNEKETTIESDTNSESSNFNYIRLSKNNKILSGRFINRVVSDNHSTYMNTKIENDIDNQTVVITLNLPHCQLCIIDPDFSVLIAPDFKSTCDEDGSRNWVLPLAVALPIAGCAAIAGTSFLIYRKKRVENVLEKQLKTLNKNQ